MKTIFTALSPNVESDDVRLALSTIFKPWIWKEGGKEGDGEHDNVKKLETAFQKFLPAKHAVAFTSGRGALHAILKSFDLKVDDEVLLQAYTCVAVPEPILWNDYKPVYVDINARTYTMSAEDLEKKITPRSKVLIIQHTFGFPADLSALLSVARKHHLLVVEDCAHALGARYDGKNVGTFGDASFFSFGRDKVISSVFGGIAVTGRDDVGEKILACRHAARRAPSLWILQQLVHPLITALVKAAYDWLGFGRALLKVAQAMRILSKAVEPIERKGGQPRFVDWKMPNALAILALHQFSKLEKFNRHREKIVGIYDNIFRQNISAEGVFASGVSIEGILRDSLPPRETSSHASTAIAPVYLRYTIRHAAAHSLIGQAKKQGMILGDWYTNAIAPTGVRYDMVGYDPATCPIAEQASRETFNVPTSITISEIDARRIAGFVANFIMKYGHEPLP